MDMDKIKRFLQLMGFQKISKDVYRKVYKNHDNYVIEVNLKNRKINYNGAEVEGEKVKPQGRILIGEKTTSNLSQPENLVVLECVNRLLEKGYKPEHIHLEKKWTLGRTAKGGRADIVVYDRGENLFTSEIEEKAFKIMKKDSFNIIFFYFFFVQ